jgi:DNA-binding response OmpR family regulator
MTENVILLVDDDPAFLESLSQYLITEGYEVEVAVNGAEALTSVERRLPTLIILDIQMPVIDGFQFARLLRERGLAIPLIAMSAAGRVREYAERIQADSYVSKPVMFRRLLASIEKALTKRARLSAEQRSQPSVSAPSEAGD